MFEEQSIVLRSKVMCRRLYVSCFIIGQSEMSNPSEMRKVIVVQ